MNDSHTNTFFCLSEFFFLLLLFSICNFAFFAIIRNARVKHMHVGIEREGDQKKKKVFHSQKNRLLTSKRKSPDSGGNCLAFQWVFLPATKFTMKSRFSPSSSLCSRPRYLPSIEYFRVHWWLGGELLAFCQSLAPFTVGLRTGELPSQGWGSFRVSEVETMLGRGSCPFPFPSPLGVARKLSEFFSVDFSTFEIILESFKWSERDAERINFGTVRLIFRLGLN